MSTKLRISYRLNLIRSYILGGVNKRLTDWFYFASLELVRRLISITIIIITSSSEFNHVRRNTERGKQKGKEPWNG